MANKYLQDNIPNGNGTLTSNVYDFNGNLLNVSGPLSWVQFGDNPSNRRALMTDPATGTCRVVQYRNGGEFANWKVDFPAVETAGVYSLQESPTAAETAVKVGKIQVQPVLAINTQQARAALSPLTLGIVRGDFYAQALPGALGTIVGRSGLTLTAKETWLTQQPGDTDSQATFQITEAGGLIILNGSTSGIQSNWASLVVTDEQQGTAILTMKADMTSQLGLLDLTWDVQVQMPNGPSSPILNGRVSLASDVTQKIVA